MACEKGLVGCLASQKQGSFSHSSGSRNLHTHTRSSSCTRFAIRSYKKIYIIWIFFGKVKVKTFQWQHGEKLHIPLAYLLFSPKWTNSLDFRGRQMPPYCVTARTTKQHRTLRDDDNVLLSLLSSLQDIDVMMSHTKLTHNIRISACNFRTKKIETKTTNLNNRQGLIAMHILRVTLT